MSRAGSLGVGSRACNPRRATRGRDGRAIAWSAVGDGPLDLLYVPQSVSAMEHIWDHPTVTAFFTRLTSFCRLILFDRRGSGMSERLEIPASLEERVDDVHAGIADAVAGLGPEVRAGLHTDECEIIGDDVGGLAVHIAARVMASVAPREVLVSGTVKDLVVGSELRFDDRGEHELRGVPGAWRLWAVAA